MPGPGHTDPRDKYSSKNSTSLSWSMCMNDKHPNRKDSRLPAPNHYKIRSTIGDGGHHYGFGLKPFIDPLKMRTTTGPGDYNPESLHRVSSAVITCMPNERDINVLKKIPGPGTY